MTEQLDVKELFRKEIAKWKEEDPLFMAYVYGYEAGKKDGREKLLDEVNAILDVRKMYMEELFDELRDPAVAKHSLQQIEIIRHRVDDLSGKKDGE